MTVREEIEAAKTKAALLFIAKRLQVRKVPAGASFDTLKRVLLNVVGTGEVHTEGVCRCTHLLRQHFVNNETGEAFECKVPSCDCKGYQKTS